MQIVPIASPANLNPGSATSSVEATMTPRERAIKAFVDNNNNQSQTEAVRNPNRVSMEELSAVKAPTNGQSTTNEAPASVAPEAPKAPEETLSSQYAALARREKAARARATQQATELKAAQDALAAERASIAAQKSEYESKYVAKDSFQADPLKALTDAGLSYDQITEMLLNQSQAPTNPAYDNKLAQLNAKIAELEAKTTSATKLIEDRDIQARTQAVAQIQADVNKLIFTDPAYETIKATGQAKEVTRLIEETFDKEGVLMTVEEAALAIEDYLVEEMYNAVSKSEKVRKRLQPVNASPAQKQTTPSSNNQLKTLSNSVSSTRQLSAKERAILAFKGELKN